LEDLVSSTAISPAEVWTLVTTAADEVAKADAEDTCPTIIHFSRFEEAYLRQLHSELTSESSFPFDIICTHEIVRRLLPELPRRGLRAVAGYFGHTVPELRRSAHHVVATVRIWHRLVDILEKQHAIQTLEELRSWLATTEGSITCGRAYPMEVDVRLRLPQQPGVYRMLRSNGDLLYIGKARSLKKRVNSYFQKRRHHSEHILEMLTQACQLDVTITESALEAAIQESDEIKQWSPPYNIALRERNRRIAFSSPDGQRSHTEPSDEHPIGPLPSLDSLWPLGMLAEALLVGTDFLVEDGSTKLGMLPEYAPETDCLFAGVELFRSKHSQRLSGDFGLSTLTRLGCELWRERLQLADEQDPEEDEEERDSKETWEWTPERVATWLENLATRGSHLVRRGRWLCLLSESVLTWETKNVGEHRKKTLVFSKGKLHTRERDLLPDFAKTLRDRQKSFDIATYDRLVVVTTELKRLLSEDRQVEIRLRDNVVLRNEKLAKGLRWV
jgi:DNA polymerase-3 subunit epsilon